MSNWLTYSPISGHGNGTITITADTISSLENRVATIIASNSQYGVSDSVLITQYKASPTLLTPLTFNILSAGTINWTATDTAVTKTIEYKVNDGEWASITSNTGSSAPTITVKASDKIQFRGNNEQYATGSYAGMNYNSFSGSTAWFEVEGNIMSLIYGDDFKNNSTISSDCTFTGLFRACANLVSAENLVLPATSLTDYCYQSMFHNCANLTTAPALPATTLAQYCYVSMFGGCTSLKTAPELPATRLFYKCYASMFAGCTSLTTAPSILPATNLAWDCYNSMFVACHSLTKAPELPATELVEHCYDEMFRNCSSLNYIKCLAKDISTTYGCTNNWVWGVASTGTFVKASSMKSWKRGDDGIPTRWAIRNE